APHSAAEQDPRLIRSADELRMQPQPYIDGSDGVPHPRELPPTTRRHPEEPPTHPLESAHDLRPGLGPGRVEARRRGQLDRKGDAGRHLHHVVAIEVRGGGCHGWRLAPSWARNNRLAYSTSPQLSAVPPAAGRG